MPRISMFFGIVVYMYYDDHAPPHAHVLFEGEEVIIDFAGSVTRGRLPSRAQSMVSEWAQAHQTELHENWARARESLPLRWIEPLR